MREFGQLESAIMDVIWAGNRPYAVREVRERRPGLLEGVIEAPPGGDEAQLARDRRAPKIHVGEEDPRVGSLGERAREIDRGRRLAVADAGARDADDLQLGVPAQRLHDMAEHAVVLGLERGKLQETHEVLVHGTVASGCPREHPDELLVAAGEVI